MSVDLMRQNFSCFKISRQKSWTFHINEKIVVSATGTLELLFVQVEQHIWAPRLTIESSDIN